MTADRCTACNGLLPGRSPNSPDARYCQEHWWAEQERLWLAGEPAHPLTWRILERRLEAKRGRPVTDWPVGTLTARKRALDAELSALVTPNNGYTPPRKDTTNGNQ